VNVTKAALPVLRQQGAGHIIQVSSIGGRLATAGLSAYQAAKWAVGGFSEVLAKEVAPLGLKVTVLEPGGMQTDWAGASMHVPPISSPYRPTVGEMARIHNATTLALGDPAKVAQVILQLTDMDNPPLRLILGSEAYAYATAAARTRAEEDARWHELTVSTDRDDATDADRDPLEVRSA
jgi:NAD(P)-dependent dehydrogenase (short-subunit alcohol dehydrogenase family)